MSGMTINGVHSSEVGLARCVPLFPLVPERRTATIEIPGRDGNFDLQTDSYAPFELAVDCLIKNEANLETTLRQVALWLNSGNTVIFDDKPIMWRVKLNRQIELNRYPKAAHFLVYFECQPFAEDVDETVWAVDTETDYGSDVEFDPAITVTLKSSATYAQVSLLSTGRYVRVTDTLAADDVLVFDMSIGKVTKNGASCMDKVDLTSLFFSVPPGNQEITVTTDGTYTASMAYRKRYLYG